MPNIGPFELIIILVVVLLLFGTTRLPKLAKSLGEASKEFKKGVNDGEAPAKAVGTAPAPDETVTLTKAEYDALRREAEARRESPPTP